MRLKFALLLCLSFLTSAASARDLVVTYKLIGKNKRSLVMNSGGSTPIPPASTLKLFTAWAALQEEIRSDAILARMLQNSDNDLADDMAKALGGVQGVQDTLERDGVPLTGRGFHAVDGSGLSIANRLPCDLVILLLEHIYDSPHYERFRNLMAKPGHPGVNDQGTLKDRLLSYRGKIFAKTGTLKNTIALSGYAVTKSGTLLFCMNSQNFNQKWDLERAHLDNLLTTRLKKLDQ